MGEVVWLDTVTTLDSSPDRFLEGAMGKLRAVVILGYDHDGNEYVALSQADGGDVLWLMRRCEKMLLEVAGRE